MNKEEVLKQLFQLSKEDILDVLKILEGYIHRLNKSGKDTLLARSMFASGYHNTKELQEKFNITKDNSLIQALSNEIVNIKTLNILRKEFNIDNETFIEIVNELGGNNE